jgi:thiol-disulfide isomerase/thioredoxin
MQKMILFVTGLVCAAASLHAQSPTEIKPLHIGDTLPDITLNHIINYKTTSARLSDFRGKLVILDFFATWCSNCIAALPHQETLQKTFNDRLRIFVVAYESEKKISDFLEENPIGKNISLPFIASDNILHKWFPHKLIPHEVWINPNGTLKATTATDQLTAANIENLLAGKSVRFKIKKDVENFSMQEPLLFNRQIGLSPEKIKYYAMVTSYIEGIPGNAFVKRDSNNRVTRICLTNYSVRHLYRYACSVALPENRCLLCVKDSGDLVIHGDYTAWARHHTYCYELSVPATTLKKAKRKMLQDLVSCFGYHTSMEIRNRKCLVLTAGKNIHNAISKGGKPHHNFSNSSKPKYMINQPLSTLVYYLNYTLSEPIQDETRFSLPVDLQLPDDLSDTGTLKRYLKKYGLMLTEEIQPVKVFVLSDH